ncbi:uncharacterized protein [Nicotiana tomentosiformis]|uniref:uncharacterized protein n=1 Tax=Nicotiana tomentosiformis TaxID=4098 RepID=UPI00388C6DFC
MGPVMSDEEQKLLERFGRLKPPSFSGVESEDTQDFLDRCQQILRTAGILETIEVSFTTFQLSGAAFRWWETYKRSSPADVAPLSWNECSVLFLEKFVPPTNWLVPTEREKIRRFIDGLSYRLRFVMTQENASGARFDEVVDIAWRLELVCSQEREEREAKRPHGSGGFSGVSSEGGSSAPGYSGSYFGSRVPL